MQRLIFLPWNGTNPEVELALVLLREAVEQQRIASF